MKLIKPSDKRCLFHECCVCSILKELPALIIALQSIYEESGYAELYRLALALRSYSIVAAIVILSAVLK